MYAAGKIPGAFFRREGRPSTDGHPERPPHRPPPAPALPQGHAQRRPVSSSQRHVRRPGERPGRSRHRRRFRRAHDLRYPLCRARQSGPRRLHRDGEYVVNPTYEQLENSQIDIVVAGTKDAICMVEAGATEVSEEILLAAMEFAARSKAQVIALQEEMIAAIKTGKGRVPRLRPVPDELKKTVFDFANTRNSGPPWRWQGRTPGARHAGRPQGAGRDAGRAVPRQAAREALEGTWPRRSVGSHPGRRCAARRPQDGRDPPDQRRGRASCRERTAPASSLAARRRR